MIKLLKDNIPLYAVWLVMLGCISVGIATTNILSIAALIIFAAFLLLSPIDKSCVLLFGIMPFANIFKYTAGTTSFFTICELLLILVSVLKMRKLKPHFLIVLMAFAAYLFVTDAPNTNFLGIVKLLAGFYLIYLTTANIAKDDAINIGYMLSGSTILMMLLSLNTSYFTYIEPYLSDLNYLLDLSTGRATETMRTGGFLGDPNYCGVLILVVIAFLCTLYYYKKIKAEFWIFIAFLIPLGFFTYSRAYFLCIAALVMFLILFVLFPKHKGWAIVSIITISIIVTMAISGRFETINAILERFSIEDFTSGRMDLNRIYLDHIWNNPGTLFFGEGISTDRLTARNNVHNIYIETIFKFGALGSLLYLIALFTGLDFAKSKKRRRLANFFPLIFMAISYFALAGITMYEFPIYLAIAFLAINFNSMSEQKAKHVMSQKEIEST